jgi:hypothetical protein
MFDARYPTERTPYSPTIPMQPPAANPDKPQQRPAANLDTKSVVYSEVVSNPN